MIGALIAIFFLLLSSQLFGRFRESQLRNDVKGFYVTRLKTSQEVRIVPAIIERGRI